MKTRRKERKEMRQSIAAATRGRNRPVKIKERERRDARMIEEVRAGSLPYAPTVMSWLSRKLDKRATKITPENIQTLLN